MSGTRRLAACGAALTLGLVACGDMPTGVSSQISPEYRETVRAFYRGLASLEVGLLDDAQAAFERAAALAPDEPAIRANLAVVHVGFGNEAEAAGHIEAARGLAPDSAEVRFLEAQLAGFQGRFEEAVAGYRQVVELDPDHLRARYALAQELDRAGGDAEAAEAQAQLEAIRDRQPGNLAVLVQHARVAARRQDAPALTDTVERLQGMTGGWPDLAVTQLEGLSAAVDEAELARAQRPAQLLRNVLVRLPAFREDQARVSVSAEAIAEPLMRFLVLPSPPATASPRGESLAYVAGPIDPAASGDQTVVAVVPGGEEAPIVFAANGQEARRLGDPDGDPGFPFPAGPAGPPPTG
ncbi:MAG: tetratricopeptide repeat protein, partial [Acidobacteria bacterium]|nr:tetratricopeptide repeat protein [Acidobacteriota bacterium]